MNTIMDLKLVAPAIRHTAAPELSPDQADVVGLGSGTGPVLVWGAPGTGKTTVLVEAAVRRIEHDGVDPAGVLMLAPSRLASAALRDQLTARLDRTLSTSPARTWSSYAFDVLRRAKAEGRLAIPRPPKLLSGPEQDLIIADLLAGHAHGLVPPIGWPDGLREALGTRGFRQEVRQLFDRVIEYGVTAADLAALGRRHGRPEWAAAARLFAEYRDLIDIRMPEAFDPAGIITAVRRLFAADPQFLAAEQERLQLIVVDDLQEANPAVFELLALLARGKDIIAAACPQTVVQGFRGARPDLVSRVPDLLAPDGGSVLLRSLTTSHRLPPQLQQSWLRVARRTPATAGAQRSLQLLDPQREDEAAPAVCMRPGRASAHVVASPVHEMRYIAQRILEVQLKEGKDPGDIAVIVRTGGQLARLQRYLTGQGIPIKVPVAENPVRDEVAVRPLLEAYQAVLEPDRLTPDLAAALLTSRIGGATAIDLRRLRQALRREELLGGGGRGSDELLVEALNDPHQVGGLGWEARHAARIAEMLAAGRKAAGASGANAETTLWALWNGASAAKRWAETALAGGPAGPRADRDLDAVMALFQTAERYVDQLPGSSPAQFLEYLLSQELPMDSLARRAQVRDAVELLTPASAAGREWPVVIVPGLQEGVWPNLRLRGELLGSSLFVDVMEGAERDPASMLKDVRYDELRSFSAAISRAREQLICTAVASVDEQPSQFIDIVDPLPDGAAARVMTEVQRPLTLRAMVAELRQYVQQPDAFPAEAAEAVELLARMSVHHPTVPGADPDQWWGLPPLSSTSTIIPDGAPVPVSPSKLQAVLESPLAWFVSAAGGEADVDFARSLGTLVHAIAQDLPAATGTEYAAELARRWPTLGMKENWEGTLDFKRAEAMVRKLAAYVIGMRAEGRSLLAVEADFSVDIGTATLRGQVDRLEVDAEGKLVIVDLKTGKNAPRKDDLAAHPQLGAYQAAVLAGGFDDVGRGAADLEGPATGQPSQPGTSGGAALVQLGTAEVGVKIQSQLPLTADHDWATELIGEAAVLMSGAAFEARHDPKRSTFGAHACRVPYICPICPEGKQVTE